MRDCHDCRYHLPNERSPYCRCLLTYGEGVTLERLKSGLIGQCDDWKPFAATTTDESEG